MEIHRPVGEELERDFGEGARPLAEIPAAIRPRLEELERHLGGGARLSIARDWEDFVVALVDDDERFAYLYFTDAGKIAHGGVNQPHYVPTVEELP